MPATQSYMLEGVGAVTLYKRRGAKNIRLSITNEGRVRVTLPFWVPYKLGKVFVEQKRNWLLGHLKTATILKDKSRIGKSHQLVFKHKPVLSVGSRVSNNYISIVVPLGSLLESQKVQGVAHKAAVRALKVEAKALLPKRLAELAHRHGFEYQSVSIKQLRSRWGSCSQNKEIVLNCFLMQLPWDQIDYVILHELVHTQVLTHGKPFWDKLALYVPNLPAVRKQMRQQQPRVQAFVRNP